MPLSWRARLAYSVGHVLNDLCASVWFTYTLVFFKFGVNIPTSLAGTIVLLGQVADGLATLFVGYFSDRTNDHGDHQLVTSDQLSQTMDNASDHGLVSFRSSRNYRFSSWCPAGRKRWHLAGSLIVLFSFPLLFGSPVGAMNASTLAKMIYYCPVVILFQIGWAYVQVTHLALMNDLTLNPGERTLLTSLRYLFTVLSNLAVYLSTYFLLLGRNSDQLQDSVVPPSVTPLVHTSWHLNPALVLASHPRLKWLSSNQEEPEEVVDFGREDLPVFRNLSLVIVGAGALMTVLFHVGVRNSDQIPVLHLSYESIPPPSDQPQAAGDSPASSRLPRLQISSWKSWLRLPLFWTQGFFYMTVRVIVNVSQAYITVYLLHSLHLPKSTMALVPLTIYLTSILSLVVQKPIQDRISRELNTVTGLLFVASFCVLANYPGDPVQLYRVYIAASLLGIGCTIILITALAMVSDLIGGNPDNGAFVYGYMSFIDKLINGIVIQLIETLWNTIPSDRYYKNVEVYGIGGWIVAGVAFLILQTVCKYRTYGTLSLFRAANQSTD